ncbi:hypothetical protein FH972_023324 [Carpinus fangiana]|uniref:Uncharacterized protein n=1 Tax=Carpinus fangiana TaxID=176857 RepID=A0A5N6KUW3_9ROSI|nr:hypothetical protein FH972_023324 [Carpinus fangiana]
MSTSDGPGKLEEVKELLADLKTDLKDKRLSAQERLECLEELKVHGRDPTDADPIFEVDGVKVLTNYAFQGATVKESREALRVLANALLLKPATRQMLADLSSGGTDILSRPGAFESVEDEFLSARVLFLLTYGTTVDFDALVTTGGLATKLQACLTRHADPSPTQRTPALGLMREMALAETLKLVFNVAHLYPATLGPMSACTAPILALLQNMKAPPLKPLVPPITLMLNALLNLDFTTSTSSSTPTGPQTPLYADAVASLAVERLLTTLDDATKNMAPAALDAEALPLVAVLRKLYALGSLTLQHAVETRVLPAEDERVEPLGRSDRTLASRLLRLSAGADAPRFGAQAAVLLYECSGRDAERFVRNVGFGHASGFLANSGLGVPQGGGGSGRTDVNFVTGQLLEREEGGEDLEMTVEEKEREAERMFVLFERLRATGVVDVKNPLREAVESGRLQEVDGEDNDSD